MNSFVLSWEKLKNQGIDALCVTKSLYERGQVFIAEEITGKTDFSPEELRAGILKNVITRSENVTLVGDDECIPFFKLENPASDADVCVLSDNPYGCLEEEFLVPDFPVSRIPSDRRNPDFLLYFIRNAADKVSAVKRRGVSAEVWEKASSEVYAVLSPEAPLILSPPAKRGNLDEDMLSADKSLLYFNVHGDKKRALWFGQGTHEYPPLLSSSDIISADKNCVVSEACYGALLDKRGKDDSIPIAFLKKGAQIFVGSTTISYGPYSPPSQEADLIVKYFLQYALRGFPAAQALKNAKVDYSRKMIRQQGFLDEDDKKTLLQFVVYGLAGTFLTLK
ncbi:hypothetical protein JW890_07260 [candidate division WOR-3 bacterium]|nr:hypothetical protein [candidate division WOR-3 bacterium]